MRILIAEDESLSRKKMEHLLHSLPHVEVVASVADGQSALDKMKTTPIDIALLDIEMPLLNGMGLAQELRQHSHAEIIFITAYDQYAVDAFDVESADYVLKPVSKERLVTALERARKRLIARSLERTLDYAGPGWHSPQTTAPNPPQDEPVYWAQTSQGQIRVAISAVIRIEACKDYAYLHLPNRQIMIRETMASLEEEFSAHGFLRVHRSHIINVDRVERLSHDGRKRFVHLDEGSYVPLGQSYRERLEASLNSTSLLPPKTGTDQL